MSLKLKFALLLVVAASVATIASVEDGIPTADRAVSHTTSSIIYLYRRVINLLVKLLTSGTSYE